MKNLEDKQLERMIHRMLSDRSADAPADALQYAKNLYRTRAASPKTSIIHRVMAVMQVDLTPDRSAFGERSAAGSQARQMLFGAGEHAVDLRVTAAKIGFDIRGQILGDGFENGDIEIANNEISNKIKIDKTSEFRVLGLPAGKYNFTIMGENAEIVIEQIELK